MYSNDDRNNDNEYSDPDKNFDTEHEYNTTDRDTEIEQPNPSIATPSIPSEMPPR